MSPQDNSPAADRELTPAEQVEVTLLIQQGKIPAEFLVRSGSSRPLPDGSVEFRDGYDLRVACEYARAHGLLGTLTPDSATPPSGDVPDATPFNPPGEEH